MDAETERGLEKLVRLWQRRDAVTLDRFPILPTTYPPSRLVVRHAADLAAFIKSKKEKRRARTSK